MFYDVFSVTEYEFGADQVRVRIVNTLYHDGKYKARWGEYFDDNSSGTVLQLPFNVTEVFYFAN